MTSFTFISLFLCLFLSIAGNPNNLRKLALLNATSKHGYLPPKTTNQFDVVSPGCFSIDESTTKINDGKNDSLRKLALINSARKNGQLPPKNTDEFNAVNPGRFPSFSENSAIVTPVSNVPIHPTRLGNSNNTSQDSSEESNQNTPYNSNKSTPGCFPNCERKIGKKLFEHFDRHTIGLKLVTHLIDKKLKKIKEFFKSRTSKKSNDLKNENKLIEMSDNELRLQKIIDNLEKEKTNLLKAIEEMQKSYSKKLSRVHSFRKLPYIPSRLNDSEQTSKTEAAIDAFAQIGKAVSGDPGAIVEAVKAVGHFTTQTLGINMDKVKNKARDYFQNAVDIAEDKLEDIIEQEEIDESDTEKKLSKEQKRTKLKIKRCMAVALHAIFIFARRVEKPLVILALMAVLAGLVLACIHAPFMLPYLTVLMANILILIKRMSQDVINKWREN